MKKLIGDFNKGVLRLIVIDKNRENAWNELLNVGAEIVSCSASMGEINCQGDINSVSSNDIEKLERDGWKWIGVE